MIILLRLLEQHLVLRFHRGEQEHALEVQYHLIITHFKSGAILYYSTKRLTYIVIYIF